MELLILDQNFQPIKIYEDYQSLIWTERYSSAGDFQMVATNIAEVVNLFSISPRETYVTLRESTVPMVVEAQKIENPGTQNAKITVVGRSFETVLERRASYNKIPASETKQTYLITALKASDAAYKAIRLVIGDGPVPGVPELQAVTNDMLASPLDVIPEISITYPVDYETMPPSWSGAVAYNVDDVVYVVTGTPSQTRYYKALEPSTNVMPGTDSSKWYELAFEVKTGTLYSAVLDLIATNHHGIKSVRPLPGSSKTSIEIYNGADATDKVTFDARFDEFDSANYVLSKQGSANVAYVYGAGGASKVLKTQGPEPSGLDRRVIMIEETSDLASEEARNSRGLIELYNANVTALFDGAISAQIASRYNKPSEEGGYFLGDIVKLVGDYGLSQNVRVAEFIRSSDSSGEKSYPTFQAVDE